jgi:hypothetical protein
LWDQLQLLKMATKVKRAPKYQLMLILKDEYKKAGRPDNFTINSNNLEKLLLFANRHTGRHKRMPWQYVGVWRNTSWEPFENGELLFWQRLAF